jgi:TP53 regulating kinase and related kinases
MANKFITQGAEAKIYLEKNNILKNRIKKSYRLKELDEKIRKSRTKKEAKILEKASKLINVPKIINIGKFSIKLEYINGDKLSNQLNYYSKEKQEKTMQKLGKEISKLHTNDIIHGDLTTSNTILKKEKLYIIDFGLGFISKRIEDKAVDLHLIKQALEAKHWQAHQNLFNNFLKGYQNYKEQEKVLAQLKKVESRGRYRH